MKYKEIKISIPKDICENFTDFLDSINISNYYEVLYDSESRKSYQPQILQENTSLYIYLEETDLQNELKILIFLKSIVPDHYFSEQRIVEPKEFENSFKEHYKPFNIGTFWIIPIWEKKSFLPPPNTKPIYLNPGMAFGTGQHETTKLMLRRIQDIVRKEWKVLDMGVGSGILSIASGLLGASEIVSIDIDPNAIKASNYNIQENFIDLTDKFLLKEGSFDHPILSNRHFDIVLANITFSVISKNIALIRQLNSSIFLFSGVLLEKKEDLISLLKDQLQGKVTFEDTFNEWIVLEWTLG